MQAALKEQDLKKRHVNVYDVTIASSVRDIAEGRLKIKSVGDLIRLIDARWKLAQPQPPVAAVTNMQFNGPTRIDMGLEKMSREERIKFLQEMVQGIIRVQTRPPMGSRSMIERKEV